MISFLLARSLSYLHEGLLLARSLSLSMISFVLARSLSFLHEAFLLTRSQSLNSKPMTTKQNYLSPHEASTWLEAPFSEPKAFTWHETFTWPKSSSWHEADLARHEVLLSLKKNFFFAWSYFLLIQSITSFQLVKFAVSKTFVNYYL